MSQSQNPFRLPRRLPRRRRLVAAATALAAVGAVAVAAQDQTASAAPHSGLPAAVSTDPAQTVTVTDVRLEQREVPSGRWVPVTAAGAVEGNQVRLSVTIHNGRPTEARLSVQAIGEDDELQDLLGDAGDRLALDVPASGDRVVTTPAFDTDGLAWTAAGDFEGDQHALTVRVEEAGDPVTAMGSVPVPTTPRPFVLVPGIGDDPQRLAAAYRQFLGDHAPGWQGFVVGDGQGPGGVEMSSLADADRPAARLADNVAALSRYVQAVREKTDAQQVDLVGHVGGGLVARAYAGSSAATDAQGASVARKLILLGTPNRGTACADVLPLPALWDLRTDVVPDDLGDGKVAASALYGRPESVTCVAGGTPGDGLVERLSAISDYTDRAGSRNDHTADLLGQATFAALVVPRLADTGPRPEMDPTGLPTGGPWQLAASDRVVLPAGGDVERTVVVEPGTGSVMLTAAGARVSATLIDPTGTEYPAEEITPVGLGEGGITSVREFSPEPGVWQVRLHSASASARTAGFAVSVTDPTVTLDARATLDAERRAHVSVSFEDGTAPPAGATVTARIRSIADGREVTVRLASDGRGVWSGVSPALSGGRWLVISDGAAGGVTRVDTVALTVPGESTGPGQGRPSATVPVLRVDPRLRSTGRLPAVALSWRSTRAASYRFQYRSGSGPWRSWATAGTSALFGGHAVPVRLSPGGTYGVRVAAVDTAGRVTAFASTTIALPQDDAAASYRGRWQHRRSPRANWLTTRSTSRIAGASATFRGSGTRFTLYGPRRPRGGSFDVIVDGRRMGVVSTASSARHRRVPLWSHRLAPGRHTVRLVVRPGHRWVTVDAWSFR